MSEQEISNDKDQTELLADLALAEEQAENTKGSGTGGGGGAGKVQMQDVHFVAKVCK